MIEANGERSWPMQGIELWKNPKNKFLIFQCHYTADPDKRSEEYRKEKELSLPRRKFMMEYELKWDSFSGLPVYGDTWNDKVHTTKDEIIPETGLPILIGMDFGLTPACILAQLSGHQLRIFKEIVEVNMGTERFATKLVQEILTNYPIWSDLRKDVILFIDPSGAFRKDTNEGTSAKILDQKGFKRIIPGEVTFEARRTSVEYFLTRMSGGEPSILVSAKHCPMLIKGFNGGYCFKEGQDEIEPSKLGALKNEYSHIHDALQYLCSRVTRLNSKVQANVPIPRYNWMK